MPHVSVITTVYNGERFFDRAVPSILDQAGVDFEWVIVDDGSTDRTPELLADLVGRDLRVRVRSPGRLGRARALNLAVEHARGIHIAN
jgi:glycosyltransferase involved in cell wall biosynthesis